MKAETLQKLAQAKIPATDMRLMLVLLTRDEEEPVSLSGLGELGGWCYQSVWQSLKSLEGYSMIESEAKGRCRPKVYRPLCSSLWDIELRSPA